ncbi:DNA primase family protein [Otariodibacter oris]|uniref:Putative DNA primase/helicase n=1 Tax=Otariodibacter oris TaxID=1032623 RepID=A0A420XIF1_9PAST|nr:DUF5906 domain-containing protein [Otariodibacter oris]RKR77135.1 putative DNA primase/helicase [Otariodibacter oris]
MSKLISAPNFKKQAKQVDVFTDWIVLVGDGAMGAYYHNKKAGEGVQWGMIRDTYKLSLDRVPVIIDSKSFDQIENLKIAPEDQKFIKIIQVGDIPTLAKDCNCLKTRILMNLAQNMKSLSVVEWLDNVLQGENVLPEIEKIKNGQSAIAELMQQKVDSEVNIDLKQKQFTQKEILEAFLRWHKSPLRRDITLGETYQYNDIYWEIVSDEMLHRKCMAFYEAFNGDYTAARIKRLAELVIMKIEEMPQEQAGYIGFKNGVLNKKTGEFSAIKASHYLRYIEKFECKVDSLDTPHFNQWLDFASNNNAEKKDVLLAGLYMILTNQHGWQLFLEATGKAGAGKSVFGEIATIINGTGNTAIINLQSMEDPKGRSILIGKTFAYSPDQKHYRGPADELKNLTGGDQIKVKRLYKDEIQVKVDAVFMMTTNYPITFTDRNGGIARRRVIILFDREVPENSRDVNFVDKVKSEVYGIVNLLLKRFSDPTEAKTILETHKRQNEGLLVKRESNHLVAFADAFFVDDKKPSSMIWGSNSTKKKDSEAIYKAYLFYCNCINIKPLNLQAFKQSLSDALKESGQKTELRELPIKDGYIRLNVHWKDYHNTIKRWEDG